MKYFFISSLILLSLGKCFAQLNESDTIHFQLRGSITGAYQQGNVEVLNIKSRLDFSVSPNKNWAFKSQNSSLYQAFYSKKADNDIFSRNYIYFRPQRKLYPFAIAYISTNFRRKINSRYFAGAGATYQLLQQKNNVVKLSASMVYESTWFKGSAYNYTEYNGSEKINLWRATLYFAGWHYLLKRHLRFYYDAYWQPAVDNRNNYRTQFDAGLDFPIYKGLSFTTLYSYTHENVQISGIKQKDRMLTFGVAYFVRSSK